MLIPEIVFEEDTNSHKVSHANFIVQDITLSLIVEYNLKLFLVFDLILFFAFDWFETTINHAP